MSIVGWWKFNEASGAVAYDSSISSNNGTLVNTPTRVAGILGNALSFDAASSEHVSFPSDIYRTLPSFTWTCWIKTSGLGSGQVSNGIGSITYFPIFYASSNGSLTFALLSGTTYYYCTTSGVNVNDSKWHFCCFMWDGSLMKTFVDGVLKGSATGYQDWQYTNSGYIGREPNDSNRHFNGIIDDVRLYDNVLSQKEVTELSKAKILHYKMDNFQEPTTNVVTNTNLDTGWSKEYCTGILWDDIDPPYGIDSPVVSFYDTDTNQNAYWYSYGDYAPQVANTTYQVSLYVKTNDSNFRVASYTADNVESGRVWSAYITVPNDGQWHRVVWDSFLNPVGSASDSLSFHFNFGNVQGETQRTWFCAPQMEAKDHVTPFVIGSRQGTVEDCAGYNSATLTEAATPEWTSNCKIGKGCYSFTNPGYMYIPTSYGNPTNQTTVVAWFKRLGVPGTNYHIITGPANIEISVPEPGGQLRTGVTTSVSGRVVSNAGPAILLDGEWHHVAVVYDGTNKKSYLDGAWVDDDPCTGDLSGIVTEIGRFASSTYGANALIDDVRIYGTALSDDEIKELYEVRASIDQFGGFYANQITETKYKSSKLIDYYADWTVDTTGSQGNFTRNGDDEENSIISAPDPFGKEDVKIWKCTPGAVSDADGGWNHDFTCDDKKRYRMSVFIKRNNSAGTTYLGCYSCKTLAGATDSNPYFHANDPPSYGDWYLWVGLLHPSDYTGGDTGVSGVYNMDGTRVVEGTEFKMTADELTQRHRSYLYYCTDITTRQYFAYPRVDVVDGNEPTIMDLVNGLDSRLYDDLADMVTTNDYPLRIKETNEVVSDGTSSTTISSSGVDISLIDEVGPTFGLVAWWNFNEGSGLIAYDVSGNANNGTLANSPTWVGGINGWALNFGGSEASVSIPNSSLFDFGTGDFSFSSWVKPSSVTTLNTIAEIGLYTAGILIRPNGGYLQVYIQSTGYTSQFPFSMVAGNWYHVIVLRDNSSLKVFINTIQSGTSPTSTDNIAVNSVGYIGRSSHTTAQNFLGIIDDVRIYNRALSVAEIEQLYEIELSNKVKLYNDGVVYTKGINELL